MKKSRPFHYFVYIAVALSVSGHSSASPELNIQQTVNYLNQLAAEEFNEKHRSLRFSYDFSTHLVTIRLFHQRSRARSQLVYEVSPSAWTTANGSTHFGAAHVESESNRIKVSCPVAENSTNSNCIKGRYERWWKGQLSVQKTSLTESEHLNHIAGITAKPSARVRLQNALNHLLTLSRKEYEARAWHDPFL